MPVVGCEGPPRVLLRRRALELFRRVGLSTFALFGGGELDALLGWLALASTPLVEPGDVWLGGIPGALTTCTLLVGGVAPNFTATFTHRCSPRHARALLHVSMYPTTCCRHSMILACLSWSEVRRKEYGTHQECWSSLLSEATMLEKVLLCSEKDGDDRVRIAL